MFWKTNIINHQRSYSAVLTSFNKRGVIIIQTSYLKFGDNFNCTMTKYPSWLMGDTSKIGSKTQLENICYPAGHIEQNQFDVRNMGLDLNDRTEY